MNVEQVVARLWREVLNVPDGDPGEDFFEQGGDSLRAIQLASRLSDALGAEVPATAIPELRTLEELTRAVRALPPRPVGLGQAGPGNRRPGLLPAAAQTILLADELADEPGLYNVTLALALDGPLDVATLSAAVQDMVAGHPTLRSRLVVTSDGPAYQVNERAELTVELYRVRGASPPNAMARARELAAAESSKLFDLRSGPLVRALLVQVDAHRHLLVLVMHHVISDRRSRDLMARELVDRYDQLFPSVADQSFRPSVPSAPARTATPPGPVVRTSGRATGLIDAALRERLRQYNVERGVTAFSVLLACFAVLWHRCIGATTFRIGIPMSTRRTAAEHDAVGCFVEVRPMPVRIEAGASFTSLVDQVDAGLRELYDAPGGGTVDVSATYLERRPLARGGTLRWQWVDLPEPAARFAVDLVLCDDGSTIDVQMDYQRAAIEPGLAATLTERYGAVVAELLNQPDRDMVTAGLCSATDVDRLAGWESGGPVLGTVPVPVAVAIRAREQSLTPAVVTDEETVTYAELDQRAERLARCLVRRGVEPESVVALCCEPSVAFVTGALAIMKARAAYLPLDVATPPRHIARILEQAGARFAVTHRGTCGLVPSPVEPVDVDDDAGSPADERDLRPLAAPHARSLAYVVFTSGSTGSPKGVQVEHASLAALVGWATTDSAIGSGDRCAQVAAVGFDAAAWEIWSCLVGGATLRIAPPDARVSPDALARWLQRSGITVAFVPTPVLTHLLAVDPRGASRLRVVHTGGDVLHRFPPAAARYRLVNNYGPTETTVVATSGQVDGPTGDAARPTIGRPVAGTTVHVLDRNLRRQFPGAVGELFVGGAGVARGYLGDPAQTAERFLPDPFSRTSGGRLYRTGDRVRFGPDGRLEFLGRSDDQAKVSGVRVEPAEVEAALLRLPGVLQAAVTVGGADGHGAVLTAHVVTDRQAEPADLRRDLGRLLPRAMVPASVRVVPALPLTPNGKVDRAALAGQTAASRGAPVAPRTPVEAALAAVWSEVLAAQPLSVDTHLIEAGGDSLAAARVAVLVTSRFGVQISAADVLECGTVAALAHELTARSES